MQLPHIERKRTNDVGVHQHVEDRRLEMNTDGAFVSKTREGGARSCFETTKGKLWWPMPFLFPVSLLQDSDASGNLTWSTTRFGAGSYSFGSFKSCSCVSCNYISVAHNIASHAVKCDSSVILVPRLSFMVSFSCQS